MTDQQWVAEQEDPYALLNHLGDAAPRRKAVLFACACLRRCDPPLSAREAVIVGIVERSADGLATDAELTFAAEHANARDSRVGWAPLVARYWQAVEAARVAGEDRDEPAQCGLVRDVFGNPFRPATADPAWHTPTVVALARGMYDSRDFSAMPILADALMDAGCDDETVLGHCRGGGPHVRGCWVVDAILGKA